MFRITHLAALVVWVSLSMIGCSSQATPISSIVRLAPTEVASPIPTSTSLATLTLTPTLTLPVLAGTPVPLPQEPITPDNVDQIRELAILGKGRIEQLAYSPDGKILAVGTLAGVWLYDADTLKELHFLNIGNALDGLAFTEDGTKLVIDSGASNVSIWDVTTASRLSSRRIRDGYQGNINYSPGSIAFSSGATIMAATLDDLRIGLWADQGETYLYALTQERDGVYKLALSPDHKLLASGRGGAIRLWDVTTGSQLYTLEGYEIGLTALAFSPQLSEEGSAKILLAASGVRGSIKLWDALTGTLVNTLDVPNAATILAFSPDGTLLASSSGGSQGSISIRVWRVADGTLVHTLTGHTSVVSSLVFSLDSSILTSGSWDGTVRRWNTNTGTLVDRLEGFANSDEFARRSPVASLPIFLSEDSMFISNTFNNQIELWDLRAGQLVKALVGHKSLVTNLVLSADGSKLVSAEKWANRIKIWNPTTGQNLDTYEIYVDTGYGKALAISPDGQLIAEGETRAGSAVYNIADLDKWVYQLPEGNGSFTPAFSPDSQKIASFSGVNSITVSKAENGELLHTLETGPPGGGLVFSPDSQILAIGDQAGAIQFWDISTGTLLNILSSETNNRVVSLAYSPNGRTLAAGMKDAQMPAGALTPTIWLWDVQSGKLLKTIEGYQANIIYLAFSPDGTLLATASLDGTMRLWGIPPE
jgi:WD40 repeat protein